MIGGKKVCAIIPAAGGGTRMGASLSKVLMPLGGVPILLRTLRKFEQAGVVDDVVLALRPGDQAMVEELIGGAGIAKVRKIVPGGEERQDSVRLALSAIVRIGTGVVVVHDAARPFVEEDLIGRVVESAYSSGTAVTAVRPKDTVKLEERTGGYLRTPDRSSCWLAQTPQAFRTEILVEAMERAVSDGFRGTDDVSLVERIGCQVVIIEGSYRNIKITTPEDIEIAEIILKREEYGHTPY
ncbi:MAG TPA: 2-C-methyl-D-erythritol 4-phosphate cytidylyltransferase [Bacteroidota bacterium]|nr:2-C-methyl-D-erythritol 4-phosphate cytidylyltransferase [Bacteroidota bacterium]